jgi:hypothetical protein
VTPGTEMRGTLFAARRGRIFQRGSGSKSGSVSGRAVALLPPPLTNPSPHGGGEF